MAKTKRSGNRPGDTSSLDYLEFVGPLSGGETLRLDLRSLPRLAQNLELYSMIEWLGALVFEYRPSASASQSGRVALAIMPATSSRDERFDQGYEYSYADVLNAGGSSGRVSDSIRKSFDIRRLVGAKPSADMPSLFLCASCAGSDFAGELWVRYRARFSVQRGLRTLDSARTLGIAGGATPVLTGLGFTPNDWEIAEELVSGVLELTITLRSGETVPGPMHLLFAGTDQVEAKVTTLRGASVVRSLRSLVIQPRLTDMTVVILTPFTSPNTITFATFTSSGPISFVKPTPTSRRSSASTTRSSASRPKV